MNTIIKKTTDVNYADELLERHIYLIRGKLTNTEYLMFVANAASTVMYLFSKKSSYVDFMHKIDVPKYFDIIQDVTKKCTLICDLTD